MEFTKIEEVALCELVRREMTDIADLTELQLSLVGGGVGEIGLN